MTNQKFAHLRPFPQQSVDVNKSLSSPDGLSSKSFYQPKQDVFPEQFDYYGRVKQDKNTTKNDDILGTHSGSLKVNTLKQANRNFNPLEPNYDYPGAKQIAA